jgi:hypothetical protein
LVINKIAVSSSQASHTTLPKADSSKLNNNVHQSKGAQMKLEWFSSMKDP